MQLSNITKILCCAFACAALLPAQNLRKQRSTRTSLIQDHSARAVGDILSILIEERHTVINNDKVERSSTTSLRAELDAWTLASDTFRQNVLPEFDARSSRDFEGEAKIAANGNLQARMAVMIIDVMPNGNLVIAGSRVVRVDDETKTLRISGVVRPIDISSANSVASSLVAEARVSITGEGASTRMTTKGPVGVLFDTLFWAAWPF